MSRKLEIDEEGKESKKINLKNWNEKNMNKRTEQKEIVER